MLKSTHTLFLLFLTVYIAYIIIPIYSDTTETSEYTYGIATYKFNTGGLSPNDIAVTIRYRVTKYILTDLAISYFTTDTYDNPLLYLAIDNYYVHRTLLPRAYVF